MGFPAPLAFMSWIFVSGGFVAKKLSKAKVVRRAGKHIQLPFLDAITLAYLAGLIDGEGCIGIYASKPNGTRTVLYHQLQVIVGMKDEGPIQFMADSTNSFKSVKRRKILASGEYHEVKLYGQRAALFLRQVLPFLKGKADQARKAIEFYDECHFSRTNAAVSTEELERRQYYANVLKEMKHVKEAHV